MERRECLLQMRTVRSSQGTVNHISINAVELMAVVVTAYMMVVRGDNSSAVQRVMDCRGWRKEEMRTEMVMRN